MIILGLIFSTFARGDAAIHDSLTNSTLPSLVACPANFTVRRPSLTNPVLGAAESSYILQRSKMGGSVWAEYLDNVGIADFDVINFVNKGMQAGGRAGFDLPNIAIAVSGGGERAVMVGGGVMAGLDNRNSTAVLAKTGGVLQVSNYMVGLSGGSWLVSSYVLSSCPTFEALRDTVWNLSVSLFDGNGALLGTIGTAVAAVLTKILGGYPASFVDAYAVLLGVKYVNDSRIVDNKPPLYGRATLFNSIRETPAYKAFTAPFPIIVAVGRVFPNVGVDITSPIYEMTATDFGSFDPTLDGGAFIPIDYLGTSFFNGTAVAPCVVGFDNAAFLMAASGTAFGDLAAIFLESIPIFNNVLFSTLLGIIPDYFITTARIPSPFQSLNVSTYLGTYSTELDLVDGALGGENVPLFPLLLPERFIDVVVIVDASSDTGPSFNGFPDGTSITTTYLKTLMQEYKRFVSPALPTVETIIARGYNKRPTFFGGTACNSTAPKSPMYIYLPNTDLLYFTGTSTFDFEYTVQEQGGFFENGFAIATQSEILPGSQNVTWSTCLACALIDSQLIRNSENRPAECVACFKQYCWDGTNGNGTAEQTAIAAINIVTPPLNPLAISVPQTNISLTLNQTKALDAASAQLASALAKNNATIDPRPDCGFLGLFCPPVVPKLSNSTTALPQNGTISQNGTTAVDCGFLGLFCPVPAPIPSNTTGTLSNSTIPLPGNQTVVSVANPPQDCGFLGLFCPPAAPIPINSSPKPSKIGAMPVSTAIPTAVLPPSGPISTNNTKFIQN